MNVRILAQSACLGTILTVCSLAQAPVAPQKGTVSGAVTNTAGEPLRRVSLQLSPQQIIRSASGSGSVLDIDIPASILATETDSQGNFTFDDVAPGRYMLAAQRAGYLNASYSNARGRVLTVQPGQKTTDIVIKMTPQGIVGGRVVDEENEPLPGASVRVNALLSKNQALAPVAALGDGKTDADGAFAIGNLAPGRYVVSVAAPPNAESPGRSPPPSQRDIYVTTYYPDAIELAAATPIELGAGAQIRGLEIRLHKVPVFRVSGKVVNAVTGEAGSGVVVNLFRRGDVPGISARSTGVNAGDFSFDGVSPGSYVLETKSTAEAEDRSPLVGRQVISTGGRDLDGVVLQLTPGNELSGTVIVEGSPPSAWPQITLTPTEGLDYPTDFTKIDANGRFTVTGLEPAPYRLNIGSVPPPMFVNAIRFNGREMGNEPIDLASEQKGSLEIVISDRVSSLTGVVHDSAGPAGPGILVMAHRRIPGQIQNRVAQTDESGRFSFTSLPPGEYILTATDTGGWFVPLPPELIEKLGKVVTVGQGAPATTELQLITTDNLRADPSR
jgi:hypothetical protein